MKNYIITVLISLSSIFSMLCFAQTPDSTAIQLEKMVEEMYRGQNTELTKNDSVLIIKFAKNLNDYKKNEEYLQAHKEVLTYIKQEKSVPLSIELAKLLIVDDPFVMEFVFENIDIEKGNPKTMDTHILTTNILFDAFSSSYGNKALFVKHLLFGNLIEDCNLSEKIPLSAPWSYNKKEKMSIHEYASFIFLNDELFMSALNEEALNESISECKRENIIKIKEFVVKYENSK